MKGQMLKKLEDIFLEFIASNNLQQFTTTNEDIKNEIINAAKGLTANQFRNCIAKSIVKYNKIDSITVDLILDIKK